MKRVFTLLCFVQLFSASVLASKYYVIYPQNPYDITYVSTDGYNAFNRNCPILKLYDQRSSSLQKSFSSTASNVYYDGVIGFDSKVESIDTLFKNCTNLGGVRLPALESISESAFEGCTALVDIYMNTGQYERNSFKGCILLGNISVTDISKVGANAFNGCKSLSTLGITGRCKLKEICDSAFFGCESLHNTTNNETGLKFDSLQKIGTRAFSGCIRLYEFTIPETLEETGDSVFAGENYLRTVNVQTEVPFDLEKNGLFNGIDVKKIFVNFDGKLSGEAPYRYACTPVWKDFKNLSGTVVDNGFCGAGEDGENLRWYVIKNADSTTYALKIYGEGEMADFPHQYIAFYETPWKEYQKDITSVELSDGITSIGSYAFESFQISSISIPNTVTSIGESAFCFCSKLESMDLSETEVAVIGTSAFHSCNNLKSMSLPSCLQELGDYAIFNMSGGTVTLRSVPQMTESGLGYNADIIFDFTDSESPYIADVSGISHEKLKSGSYHRTLRKGDWGTIILPFVPASTENLEFYEFKEMTTADGGSLVFKKAETVQAGVPYLFCNLSDNVGFTLTADSLEHDLILTETPQTVGDFSMIGSFQALELDGKANANLYFLEKAAFHNATDSVNMSPFRAYMEHSGGAVAQSLLLIIDDGSLTSVPGIIDQNGKIDGTEAIYDLNGNLLSAPKQGQVNIIRTRSGKMVKRLF